MKNTTLAIILILLSGGTGVLTYFTSKYFTKGYAELLPVAVLFLILLVFFRRKHRIKPVVGVSLLSITMLIPLSVLFFLMLKYPLEGMSTNLESNDIIMRYLAIIGISFICGMILQLLTRQKEETENKDIIKVN